MPSCLIRYFQVLCCLDTPDGGLSRPLGPRPDTHACCGAPSIGEVERVDCLQHPVFRVVECPYSSPPSRRKASDRLTSVPPVTITDCSPYHDVSSPSRGEDERADCPQLPVFRSFPSPFSSRALPILHVQVYIPATADVMKQLNILQRSRIQTTLQGRRQRRSRHTPPTGREVLGLIVHCVSMLWSPVGQIK